jgi:hypothetical protein
MRPLVATLLAAVMLGYIPSALATPLTTPDVIPPTIPNLSAWVDARGVPNRATWRHAARLSLSYEIRPGHNLPAPVATTVFIGYTQQALWLHFVATDPHPDNIQIKYRTRDNIDRNDDYVSFIFSPFNDTQWAYEFSCNAGGIEMDAFRQQGREYDSFNAIWTCRAHRTSSGYVVTMKIPFHSIKFPHSDRPQTWRMIFFRNWARSVRHQIVQSHLNFNNDCLLCQAEIFRTATPIQAQGANWQIIPATTLLQTDQRPDPTLGLEHGAPQLKAELNVRWTIRPDLEWSATLNPTFSEVAPDALQPTFNRRFAIYYPENRPFFKQGTWVFNTSSNFVDTRQIADPHWATKLVGQLDANAIGILVANDSITNILLPGQQSSALQSFNFNTRDALLRYRYDSSNDTSVGVLATDRQGGGYDSGLLAFDGSWRLDPSDSIRAQISRSGTTYPQQVATAFGIDPGTVTGNDWLVAFTRTRSNYITALALNHIAEGFRADLGYLPQVGYTAARPMFRYNWYSNTSWWQNGGFGGYYNWVHATGNGPVLDRKTRVYTFVDARAQSHIMLFATHEEQYFPDRTFDLNDFELYARTRPLSWLRGEIDLTGGDGVDYTSIRKGRLLSIAPAFTLTPGSHLKIGLVGNFERLNVTGGRLYTANLYDVRLAWYFNAHLFVRTIMQAQNIRRNVTLYPAGTSSRSRNLAIQWLFGYVLNPFTALYAGFSSGYLKTGNTGLQTQQRTLFVKLSYDFQT